MDTSTHKFNLRFVIFECFSLFLQILLAIILNVFKVFVWKKLKPVDDEIVLITGGAQGLGKALALLYASKGATVIIWDVDSENGQKTTEEIAHLGYSKAYFYNCDVSNNVNVKSCADKIREEIGIVTILINNAGIMYTKPFLELTQDQIEKQINVNLVSHYWTIQAFLPLMIKNKKGHIVAISSIAGLYGFAFHVPYCSSKLAIKGMMLALYNEYSANHSYIKFTTVYPSGIDTKITQKFEIISPKQFWTKPENAAREIMLAQQAEMLEIGIPKSVTFFYQIYKILPQNAQNVYHHYINKKINIFFNLLKADDKYV